MPSFDYIRKVGELPKALDYLTSPSRPAHLVTSIIPSGGSGFFMRGPCAYTEKTSLNGQKSLRETPPESLLTAQPGFDLVKKDFSEVI
jgi:hypothetical protein